jgi:hypothetical protein
MDRVAHAQPDRGPVSAAAVQGLGEGSFSVACAGSCGGAGAHLVTIAGEDVACDCPASVLGHRACRHIAAVREYLQLAPLEVPLRKTPAASGYSTPPPAASAAPALFTGVHGPCEAGPGLADVDVPPPGDPA